MLTKNTRSQKNCTILTWTGWIALAVAFAGSILSAFDICTGGCSIAHEYRIFGMTFATFGIAFMVALTAMHWASLREKTGLCNIAYSIALFSAVGAEVKFIMIQKYEIGMWCPICLVIATAVGVLAALQIVKGGFTMKIRSIALRRAAKTAALTAAALVGFVVSVIGIQQPANASSGSSTWFGKKSSAVEVYVVSDWYCSYCREVEPRVEAMLGDLGKKAKYTFVDYPVNRVSFTIMPYHIALLSGAQKNYLTGRQVLHRLTENGKVPTSDEVTAALARKGIKMHTPEYPEQIRFAQEFGSIIKEHGVRMTPTVVVYNKKTGKKQVLEGSKDINKKNVLAAISTIGG